MRHATICFLLNRKENKILLGFKKRGFGAGKYNGLGGKVADGETIEQAALRELHEEAGVRADKIRKVAELTFTFPHSHESCWDQIVHVFFADSWKGEPTESEEMRPEWHDISKLPFGMMWDDDKYWLPKVLEDKRIKASFSFKRDNQTIASMKFGNLDE